MRRFLAASDDPDTLAARRDSLLRLSHVVEGKLRQVQARRNQLPLPTSHDGREEMNVSVTEAQPPWHETVVEFVDIPGMISSEEARYFSWIGRFYSGAGEAVEFGPWLGRSTYFIAKALTANPLFFDRRLHVYDDFVWRCSWMDQYVEEHDRLPNHSTFRPQFDRYTASIAEHLAVERRRLTLNDGNEHLPEFQWSGGPVEYVFADCGRTFDVNDRWYNALRESFVPNRTLIVMQDWRLHREVPVRWYNQTKQFTDSRGAELELIHEVNDGGLATFLFRG